jgi:tellurite resistance protein TehA-like permease
MTAVWLLPVVTLIVASSTGGILGHALLDQPSLALITITMSTLMVMIGLSLALMLLTVYLMRLIVHGLPSGATIISVFLPLGPTGQAGYAFLLIGRCFRELLPLKSAPPDHFLGSDVTGDVINVVCVCIAFALWALASMWLVFALLGVQEVIRRTRIPFKLPFWGLIFPNVRAIIFLDPPKESPFLSTGRVRQSHSRLIEHAGLESLSDLRCNLFSLDNCALDWRHIAHSGACEERADFRGAMFGGH